MSILLAICHSSGIPDSNCELEPVAPLTTFFTVSILADRELFSPVCWVGLSKEDLVFSYLLHLEQHNVNDFFFPADMMSESTIVSDSQWTGVRFRCE